MGTEILDVLIDRRSGARDLIQALERAPDIRDLVLAMAREEDLPKAVRRLGFSGVAEALTLFAKREVEAARQIWGTR